MAGAYSSAFSSAYDVGAGGVVIATLFDDEEEDVMQIIRKNGATSNTFRVMLRNSSTGQGLTGLDHTSTGLIISTIADNEASATAYTVAGSTIETITTLGTFATPTATKCRFKAVDATNHPGMYEIQLADARFAVSSAKVLRVTISGATNLLTKDVVIQLTTADLADTANISADAKAINSVSTSSVTTINATIGLPASAATNLNTIFNTDYATVYDATNKAFLSKLGNFAMGGSSLNLTLNNLAVGGTVTFTGAVTATNASNDIRGITVSALANNVLTAAAAAADFGAEIQALITGGAYALNTNASGYIRVVDGTGTGELDTSSGLVRLSATGVDDIWDEAFVGHQTAGTTGLVINEVDAIYQNAYDGITARILANVTHANGTLYSTAVTTPLSNLITTVGVAGAGLTAADDAVISAIAALNNLSAAQVWAAGTRTLTALGFTLAASDLAADIITAAKVAADVWTEGRTAINGGDYALSTDANGRVRIVDGTAAGELDTNAGKVLLAATQAFDNTGTWTGNLTGNVGGNIVGNILGTIAELTTTTRSLPGQVSPSATPTAVEALMQLFQLATNPTDQTGSAQRIYNRAGNVVHQKRTAADDGSTASLGALVAGP